MHWSRPKVTWKKQKICYAKKGLPAPRKRRPARRKKEIFREFVKDITLHIAAAHPIYVSRDQVSAGVIEREQEIYRAQVKGKPANVVEKIVEGKLDKFFGSVCLLDQAFIKNPDQSIRDLVSAKIAELGENIVIRRFTRYAVGEDLEGDTSERAQAA
jgi:elongation factor Ts